LLDHDHGLDTGSYCLIIAHEGIIWYAIPWLNLKSIIYWIPRGKKQVTFRICFWSTSISTMMDKMCMLTAKCFESWLEWLDTAFYDTINDKNAEISFKVICCSETDSNLSGSPQFLLNLSHLKSQSDSRR